MELADILDEESILIGTNVATKDDVLSALAQHAAPRIGLPVAEVYRALTEREALGSTGLGNGIAVPHGKCTGFNRVVAVFMKLTRPIEFDALDDRPVDIIMMLLAPIGAGADHLKALARVARLLRSEPVIESLRATDNVVRLYDLLTAPVASHQAA